MVTTRSKQSTCEYRPVEGSNTSTKSTFTRTQVDQASKEGISRGTTDDASNGNNITSHSSDEYMPSVSSLDDESLPDAPEVSDVERTTAAPAASTPATSKHSNPFKVLDWAKDVEDHERLQARKAAKKERQKAKKRAASAQRKAARVNEAADQATTAAAAKPAAERIAPQGAMPRKQVMVEVAISKSATPPVRVQGVPDKAGASASAPTANHPSSRRPDRLEEVVSTAGEARLTQMQSTLAGATKIASAFDRLRTDVDVSSNAPLVTLLDKIRSEIERFMNSGFNTTSSVAGPNLKPAPAALAAARAATLSSKGASASKQGTTWAARVAAAASLPDPQAAPQRTAVRPAAKPVKERPTDLRVMVRLPTDSANRVKPASQLLPIAKQALGNKSNAVQAVQIVKSGIALVPADKEAQGIILNARPALKQAYDAHEVEAQVPRDEFMIPYAPVRANWRSGDSRITEVISPSLYQAEIAAVSGATPIINHDASPVNREVALATTELSSGKRGQGQRRRARRSDRLLTLNYKVRKTPRGRMTLRGDFKSAKELATALTLEQQGEAQPGVPDPSPSLEEAMIAAVGSQVLPSIAEANSLEQTDTVLDTACDETINERN
ncbi:hypothetical protein AAP_04846 [Ascosphaera apis ARSEF 7405]|uniref:Uncharacterized protein n=1 Tax=Ascosphaera apis ARSEF 7405 TaxID=392613 RepID=A0A162I4J6_9EURO|nr:hypothetical protein AAP_04846 [Ascosphaera apis ARSEF 7405]